MSGRTLEDVYEAIANAIDEAGPEREALLLAKLSLLLAERVDDPDVVCGFVAEALIDLRPMGTRYKT